MLVLTAMFVGLIAVSIVLCPDWHRGGSFCGVTLHSETAGEVMLLGLCGKLGTSL